MIPLPSMLGAAARAVEPFCRRCTSFIFFWKRFSSFLPTRAGRTRHSASPQDCGLARTPQPTRKARLTCCHGSTASYGNSISFLWCDLNEAWGQRRPLPFKDLRTGACRCCRQACPSAGAGARAGLLAPQRPCLGQEGLQGQTRRCSQAAPPMRAGIEEHTHIRTHMQKVCSL